MKFIGFILLLLTSVSAHAFNYAKMTCVPHEPQGILKNLEFKLSWYRQLRDPVSGNFVKQGDSQVALNLNIAPTTLGRIKVAAQSKMTWKAQGEHYANIRAEGADGSFWVSSALLEADLLKSVDAPGLADGAGFNDLFLHRFKIKVEHPIVRFVEVTLSAFEHSKVHRLHLTAVGDDGLNGLYQLDASCEYESSLTAPTL